MAYRGSCHCGRVAFDVDGEIDQVVDCNCSVCRRKGALLWFVPREHLRVVSGEDALADYTFNKNVINHRFCANCGIHTFGEGTGPDGQRMVAVNARCLEDVELSDLKVQQIDGRSM